MSDETKSNATEENLIPENESLKADFSGAGNGEPVFSNEDLDATETTEQAKKEPDPLEKALEELNDYKDRLVRMAAEFENYKKRTQREYAQIIQNANEKLIIELLPIIDDMERMLKAAPDKDSADSKTQTFVQGAEMIYQKFMQILSRQGLKPVESVGKEFDVNVHDALMQAETPDKEPNTIIEEYEKGYWLNDKVIRHAKVIVAK